MTAPLILGMDAAPVRRARFVHYVLAALAALWLGFAAATPARADPNVDACFNAVADTAEASIDAVKSAPDFVSHNCEQWAAAPELFAAVVGVVTMLEASGAFKAGDCQDFIQSNKAKIAAALVSALAGAIGGNSPLALIIPGSAVGDIQQLAINIANAQSDQAANAAAEQAYDLLQTIPVLGQAIAMLPCACIVAEAAIAAKDKLADAASEGGDCAQFALQCVGNPIACAQSLFESGWDALQDLGKWVWDTVGGLLKDIWCAGPGQVCNLIGLKSICGCEGDPPPPVQVDCVGGPGVNGTALGGDVRDLGNGVKISLSSNTFCSCPGSMSWQQHSDGAWTCSCKNPGEVQVAKGICRCPEGKGLLEGSCQTCPSPLVLKYGACTCPVEGQNFMKIGTTGTTYFCSCPNGQGTAGNKCAPACTDVSKTLLADGTCCSPSQVSSCGVCCPSGWAPDPKSGSCVIAYTPKPGFKTLAPLKSR